MNKSNIDAKPTPLPKDPYYEERLLAKNIGLSVSEKEQMLHSVLLESMKTERASKIGQESRIGRFVFASAALAAVILVAFLGYVKLSANSMNSSQSEFTAKGVSSVPKLRISCSENTTGVCTQGDTMVFHVDRDPRKPFFAAFAKHKKTGRVIWYFPEKNNQKSIDIRQAQEKSGWIKKGFYLGNEHVDGLYNIYGFLSQHSMSRAEIRKTFERTKGTSPDENAFVPLHASFEIRGEK